MDKQNINILIAEDDYLVCEQIKRTLRDSRYTIIGEASNGEEAVKMVIELKPDLVLMDIKMPKVDGLEASRQLSEQHPLPIVILTAYESAELVKQASEVGVGAFLNKPPRLTEIENAITIAIARHQDLMEMRRLNLDLKKALDEIKTLRGIIPICSKCKKIRDEDGGWIPVELYIEDHSEAGCSHGLCGPCSDALYGGQSWYEEGKKSGKIKSSMSEDKQ